MEAASPHILQVQKEKGKGKKERGMKRSSLFPLLVRLFVCLFAVLLCIPGYCPGHRRYIMILIGIREQLE